MSHKNKNKNKNQNANKNNPLKGFYPTFPPKQEMKCYKIVKVHDNKKLSVAAENELCMEYVPGQFTYALNEAYGLGYGLMAFESLKTAETYLSKQQTIENFELWESTCFGRVARKPLPILRDYDWSLSSLKYFSFAKAETCWDEGTIVVKAIRLDRQIEIQGI